MLSKFHLSHQEHHKPSQAPTPTRADSNIEKDITTIDDSPVPLLTWRTSLLGIIASMGGFIFGYSTGMPIETPTPCCSWPLVLINA